MQCLEFRRRLLVNPGCRDAAIRQHLQSCAACSRWSTESTRFEHILREAMHIEVPENLASRILLRDAFRQPRRDRPRAFALAAGIVFTALLGGALIWFESRPTLAEDVFVHIGETSYALTSTTILDDNTIAGVFGWFGANVSPGLGDVSFANVCAFRDERVAHVVLQGSRSPVTVIIMPGEQLRHPEYISAGNRSGLLLPYAGGSMAIVSDNGQRLDALEQRLRNTIRWPGFVSAPEAVNS